MEKKIQQRANSGAFFSDTLPPLLQQIYLNRGICDEDDLDRSLAALHPPASMKGIDQACTILQQALLAQKKILIVGDFDADGATSAALMVSSLKQMGAQYIDYLVPNRFEYGYGLSPQLADIAAERHTELLITVDNGISSHQGVLAAKQHGMQVIITDHHLPGNELPAADAIINPNQPDCNFPSKNLAGVGVAFYLLMALRSHLNTERYFQSQNLPIPNLASQLDLVALGTVADVVPLDKTNRILVHQGLQRIRSGHCRPGIQALITVAKRTAHRLQASDLGFAIGPRLNAVGRLDDISLGIECLLCDDPNQTRLMAQEMDSLNKERREIESSMQQEALQSLKQLEVSSQQLLSGICLYQHDWHQGVVGLVASRIKERYHRPVIAFAQASDTELKGSGRSIEGLHLRDLLEQMDSQYPGLINKFGGHAMAAGLSININNLERFKTLFDQMAARLMSKEMLTGTVLSDGELATEFFTLDFATQLQHSGPWGQGFPQPVFDGWFTILNQRLVGEKHLKLTLQPAGSEQWVDAIAFNVDCTRWPNAAIKRVRIAYTLDINEFRDNTSLQLMVNYLSNEVELLA